MREIVFHIGNLVYSNIYYEDIPRDELYFQSKRNEFWCKQLKGNFYWIKEKKLL